MTRRRALILSGYGLGGLVGLALLLLGLLWIMQSGSILPNTTVVGIDVSGQSPQEAAETLTPLATSRHADPVVFVFEDERFSLTPKEVGYRIDLDQTIQGAMSRGRTGIFSDIVERIRALRQVRDYPLVDTYDREAIEAWVDQTADQVDRDHSSGSIEVDPTTLEVGVELPHGSAEVRREETVDVVIDALLEPGQDELELPVDTEPQLVADQDLKALAAQVERAVAEPLVLVANDEELIIEPSGIAQIIEVVEHSDGPSVTVDLDISVDKLEGLLEDEDLQRFGSSPRNARYNANRTPPATFDNQGNGTFRPVTANVEVEPGRDGTRFDPELAADRIAQLLREGARGGELPLETIEADFTTREAEDLRPTHLIGTFTTYYPGGTPRAHNIRLLGDTVDGTLVLPGEQFSINEISGQRTCAKGYRQDGMIIRGELVDVCGGGTSQFGTTAFNAAFFAGVQLDAWKAHSWYISRYPMGREATLNYPDLDVRFTNTTPGAILVKTTHSATSITVSLYGQPIANGVSATHSSPTNPTQPKEIRRRTNDLCEGESRVEQSGGGGFTVQVTRTVDRLEGDNDTQTIRTVYVPQDRIIEEGTRECAPDDDEDEDVSAAGEDEDDPEPDA